MQLREMDGDDCPISRTTKVNQINVIKSGGPRVVALSLQ